MEARIGVSQSPKELELDLGEVDRDKLVAEISKTLAKEGAVLWLTDKKGRQVGIPAAKIAYIDLSSSTEDRKVGFAR